MKKQKIQIGTFALLTVWSLACFAAPQDSASLSTGVNLQEIKVYAPRINLDATASQMSANAISGAQIRSLPTFMGELDVMKALQKLPGVQTTGDGAAGIFVRGGDYDQNMLMLDGAMLYNGEHLRGFVSAINADMVENVVLYKGAFPARFGSRLSSVVDVGMRTGDFHRYHGSLSLGLLSSRLCVEGPIWRDHTSFIVSFRTSYFNAIAKPILRKVYDSENALNDYSNMNYYDINAKVVHRFSSRDRLSAVFYYGHDKFNVEPSRSSYDVKMQKTHSYGNEQYTTKNNWGNIVSSLFWTHIFDDRLWMNVNAAYSQYRYNKQSSAEMHDAIYEYEYGSQVDGEQLYGYDEASQMNYRSGIKDYALAADFRYKANVNNLLRWGVKLSLQDVQPAIDARKDAKRTIRSNEILNSYNTRIDTTYGFGDKLKTFALYAQDEITLLHRLRANVGLRYELYAVSGKTEHIVEPRLSFSWLLRDDMSVKASYSRMSQAIHLLSSSNLVMPSDIWVPITAEIPAMTSNVMAAGFNYDNLLPGVYLSIEGYYKTFHNLIDYANGVSLMNPTASWRQMVVLGNGRAYGAEIMISKRVGKTTGWLSYTWSKSLRTFDKNGQELNGGKEFYAANDRRNNINLVVTHRFNDHWEVTASWNYQTGRRGSIPSYIIYTPSLAFSDNYFNPVSSDLYDNPDGSRRPDLTYFDKFLAKNTYRERNGSVLPATHHLDLSVTYRLNHRNGSSAICLSVYNVYNHMNITNVYLGYENGKRVLKGICPFPCMPSLTYTFSF